MSVSFAVHTKGWFLLNTQKMNKSGKWWQMRVKVW